MRQGPKPLRISIIFSWLELSHSFILSLSQFRFVGVGLDLIFGHGSWVSRCLSYGFGWPWVVGLKVFLMTTFDGGGGGDESL